MTKPLETAGDVCIAPSDSPVGSRPEGAGTYIDTYGTLRELQPAECGCCLEGVISGADRDGTPWTMAYSLPRAAVLRVHSTTFSSSRSQGAEPQA